MKITGRKTILKNDWIQVQARAIEGWSDDYYSVVVPDYACILAMTSDRKILTVRQFRPAIEAETIELPSGMVDAGEEPIVSAERELLEETGYEPAEIVAFGATMVPDTGRLENRMYSFFARDVTPHAEADTLLEAGMHPELVSEAELAAMIRDGRFNHSLHLATLSYAMLEGLIDLK